MGPFMYLTTLLLHSFFPIAWEMLHSKIATYYQTRTYHDYLTGR